VKRYNRPGEGGDYAFAIAPGDMGNVYITGSSYGGTRTGNDYATLKYNSNGTQLWVQRYSASEARDDSARAIAVDGTGGVFVTGISLSSTTYYDYATVKYTQ
jgi:hypothetical protein